VRNASASRVILATESCGCFVGIEPAGSIVVAEWLENGLMVAKVTAATAEEARRKVFCDKHRRAA